MPPPTLPSTLHRTHPPRRFPRKVVGSHLIKQRLRYRHVARPRLCTRTGRQLAARSNGMVLRADVDGTGGEHDERSQAGHCTPHCWACQPSPTSPRRAAPSAPLPPPPPSPREAGDSASAQCAECSPLAHSRGPESEDTVHAVRRTPVAVVPVVVTVWSAEQRADTLPHPSQAGVRVQACRQRVVVLLC